MDLSFVILVEVLYGVASLVLISAGLAVVFGMMKVINLAHGEFMMMGGYATITAVGLGVNVFVAMLVIAPLVVGLIGLIVERLVIRHLYGRLVDTMLATWGLSLVFIGLATMIFGNTTTGISTSDPRLCVRWLPGQWLQFFYHYRVHRTGHRHVCCAARDTRRLDRAWHDATLLYGGCTRL